MNELNTVLLSKSHLSGQSFFDQFYAENPHDEIREAIFLINSYWGRISKSKLRESVAGFKFSKPHTIYLAIAKKKTCPSAFFPTLSRRVNHAINQVEISTWFFELKHISILLPWKKHLAKVREYDEKILLAQTFPNPYFRAGIDLKLIERGFKL